MKFNEKLMLYRAKEQLTQEQLGKLLGVTKDTIYKWENEIVTPKKHFVLLFKQLEKGE